MKNKKRLQRGISLIEILLAVAVAGILIPVSVHVMQTFSKNMVSASLSAEADSKLKRVAENIRRESTGQFHAIGEIERDRTCPPDYDPTVMSTAYLCPDQDKRIRITSTIGDISANLRTREVTLLAEWTEGGAAKSKTMSFHLSQLRGEAEGARVVVTVTDYLTGDPVAKMRASAKGESRPVVECQTFEDGKCVLKGVKYGLQTVTIDAEASDGYFFSEHVIPNCNTAPAGYKKEADVLLESTLDMKALNVEACPPAVIQGVVRDYVTPYGLLPDVMMGLVEKTGTAIIPPLNPDYQIQKTTTDANGFYRFAVPPGTYSLYVLGSSSYAAVAPKGDRLETATSRVEYYQTLHSGNAITKNFETIKRGTIKVRFRGISYAPGGYGSYTFVDPSPTSRVTTWVDVENSLTHPFSNSEYTKNSYIWDESEFFLKFPEVRFGDPQIIKSDRIGRRPDDDEFRFYRHRGPKIVDPRQPLASQYTRVLPVIQDRDPSYRPHPPFTQILVAPNSNSDGLKDPMFRVYDYAGSSEPRYIDQGPALVAKNLYADQELELEYYLLTEDSFANLSGKFTKNDVDFYPPIGLTAEVFTHWNNNGYGILDKSSYDGGIVNRVHSGKKITKHITSSSNLYNLQDWAGYRPLVPNTRGARTKVHFAISGTAQASTALSHIYWKAHRVRCVDGVAQKFTSTNFSGAPGIKLKMAIKPHDQTSAFQYDTKQADGSGYSVHGPFNIQYKPSDVGNLELELKPGDNPDKIVVLTGAASYDPLYYTVEADEYWTTSWFQTNGVSLVRYNQLLPNQLYADSDPPVFTPRNILTRYRTGTISGKLMNGNGQAVSGAVVRVTGMRGSHYGEATSDSSGNFSISNVRFAAYTDISYNVTLTVKVLGTEVYTINKLMCGGMNWNLGTVGLPCPNCGVGGGGM